MPVRSVSDPISYVGNYTATKTESKAKQIVTNPSAVKKVLQIVTKIFAAIDLHYLGDIKQRPITDTLKGSIELIEFYGTFRNIMFWINPFSKDTLDQNKLLESLTLFMKAPLLDSKARKQNEQMAQEIIDEVLDVEEFHSKGDVREAVIIGLENRGYKHQFAERIADGIVIQQKARSITQLFSTACFTFTDLMGNILTLKQWGILELAPIAAQIGSQSRVFALVLEFSVGTVIGTVASAALIVTFSEATYRAITQAIKKYQSADADQREEASKELRTALLDMLSSGADLVNSAAPLIFTINPPVLVAMAIAAKTTGLICILVK